MICEICGSGRLHSGRANVTLHCGGTDVLLQGFPADICNTCGEHYLLAEATRRALQAAAHSGGDRVVVRYAA